MRSLSRAQKKTIKTINALVRRTLSTVHMMSTPSFTSFTSVSLSLCAFVCVRKLMKRIPTVLRRDEYARKMRQKLARRC